MVESLLHIRICYTYLPSQWDVPGVWSRGRPIVEGDVGRRESRGSLMTEGMGFTHTPRGGAGGAVLADLHRPDDLHLVVGEDLVVGPWTPMQCTI